MASSDKIVPEFMLHDFFLTSIDGVALCEGNRNKLHAVLPESSRSEKLNKFPRKFPKNTREEILLYYSCIFIINKYSALVTFFPT